MSNLGVTDKVILGYLIGAVLAYTILYFLFLRRWFLVRKQYRALKKKYNMDCVFCFSLRARNPFDISGDCYILADSKGIRLVNCAGTPIDIFIPYEDISYYSIDSSMYEGRYPKYYKTNHNLTFFLKDRESPGNVIFCIYFGPEILGPFNKYATRKCDFHKYIAQYIQPKTATYTK